MIVLLSAMALAADVAPLKAEEAQNTAHKLPIKADVGGHIKTFAVGVFPYDGMLGPTEVTPLGSAVVNGRLNGKVTVGEHLMFEAAHTVSANLGDNSGVSLGAASTGVTVVAPEAIKLGWTGWDDPGSLQLIGQTDRLLVKGSVQGLSVTVGRQPVAFGSGMFFTPLDLISPFTPATIDTEYKPGVDAARVDLFRGFATKGTVVVAWLGKQEEQDLIDGVALAATGQTTIGVTDVGGFAGLLRGDLVLGGTVVTSVGPIGLNSDVAVTFPKADDDDEVFARAVFGAMWRPGAKCTLTGELYVQTLGDADSGEFIGTLRRPRWTRGELWLTGVAYGGVAASFELTPLLMVSTAGFVNLTDPSAFVAPSVAWSVAENADLSVGGYVGLGSRPEFTEGSLLPEVRSEFGLYPAVGFVQMRAYF